VPDILNEGHLGHNRFVPLFLIVKMSQTPPNITTVKRLTANPTLKLNGLQTTSIL
jgi:hypothetical protein